MWRERMGVTMAYKARLVEGAVLALLLGTTGPSWAQDGTHAWETSTPPDAVDYLLAIQCSALTAVFVKQDPGKRVFTFESAEFLHWAEVRAKEAGQDAGLAAGDIKALENMIRETVKDTQGGKARRSLREAYDAQTRVCISISNSPMIVITGG